MFQLFQLVYSAGKAGYEWASERCRRPARRAQKKRHRAEGVELAGGTTPLIQYTPPPETALPAIARSNRGPQAWAILGGHLLLQQLTLAVFVAKEYVCLKTLSDIGVKSLWFDLSAQPTMQEADDEFAVLLVWMKVLSCLVIPELVAGNLNHYFFKKTPIHHTNTTVEFFETWTGPLVAVNFFTPTLSRGPAIGWLLATGIFAAFSRVFGGVGMFHVRGSYTKERFPWPVTSLAYLAPALASLYSIDAFPYYVVSEETDTNGVITTGTLVASLLLLRATSEFFINRLVFENSRRDRAYYQYHLTRLLAMLSAGLQNLAQSPVALVDIFVTWGWACQEHSEGDDDDLSFNDKQCWFFYATGILAALIGIQDVLRFYQTSRINAERSRLAVGDGKKRDETASWLYKKPDLTRTPLVFSAPIILPVVSLSHKEQQHFAVFLLDLLSAVGDLRVLGIALASQKNVLSSAFTAFIPRLKETDDTLIVTREKLATVYTLFSTYQTTPDDASAHYMRVARAVCHDVWKRMAAPNATFDTAVNASREFFRTTEFNLDFIAGLLQQGDVPAHTDIRCRNRYRTSERVEWAQDLVKRAYGVNFYDETVLQAFVEGKNPKMLRPLLMLWLLSHAKDKTMVGEAANGFFPREEVDNVRLRQRQDVILKSVRDHAPDPVLQSGLVAALADASPVASNAGIGALIQDESLLRLAQCDDYTVSLLGYYFQEFHQAVRAEPRGVRVASYESMHAAMDSIVNAPAKSAQYFWDNIRLHNLFGLKDKVHIDNAAQCFVGDTNAPQGTLWLVAFINRVMRVSGVEWDLVPEALDVHVASDNDDEKEDAVSVGRSSQGSRSSMRSRTRSDSPLLPPSSDDVLEEALAKQEAEAFPFIPLHPVAPVAGGLGDNDSDSDRSDSSYIEDGSGRPRPPRRARADSVDSWTYPYQYRR